jgi:hypothetical protein
MTEKLSVEMELIISEISSDLISQVCSIWHETLPDAVIYDGIKLSKCCIFPDLRFDEPRASLTFQLNSQYSANE